MLCFLTGSSYGNTFINWIWTLDGANFASSFGPQYGGNFLMDGTTCGDYCGSFQNFITFTWDFSQGPNLTFATPATDPLSSFGGNNIAYLDPLVSGTITDVVPEPSSIVLLSAGLGAVLFMARRRRA